MNFKKWIEGIVVAALTAGVPALADALIDPQHADFKHIGVIGVTAAILGVAAWLRNPNSGGPPPPPPIQFPSTH